MRVKLVGSAGAKKSEEPEPKVARCFNLHSRSRLIRNPRTHGRRMQTHRHERASAAMEMNYSDKKLGKNDGEDETGDGRGGGE